LWYRAEAAAMEATAPVKSLDCAIRSRSHARNFNL
jgi:hypothetical protein